MKDVFLGTFYGYDLILKVEQAEVGKFEWSKMWENYISNIKKNAVEEYKSDMFLETLKNH